MKKKTKSSLLLIVGAVVVYWLYNKFFSGSSATTTTTTSLASIPTIDTVINTIKVVASTTPTISSTTTPTVGTAITGTATAGATVNVYKDVVLLTTIVADASGNWSYTPTTAGAYAFATLESGKAESAKTSSFAVVAAPVAPVAPPAGSWQWATNVPNNLSIMTITTHFDSGVLLGNDAAMQTGANDYVYPVGSNNLNFKIPFPVVSSLDSANGVISYNSFGCRLSGYAAGQNLTISVKKNGVALRTFSKQVDASGSGIINTLLSEDGATPFLPASGDVLLFDVA